MTTTQQTVQQIFESELKEATRLFPCLGKYSIKFVHCGRIKNRVGSCRIIPSTKVVIIKTMKKLHADHPYLINNIRHELAHAITFAQFKSNGQHDRYWHAVCDRLNCTPNLTYNSYTDTVRYAVNRYGIGWV